MKQIILFLAIGLLVSCTNEVQVPDNVKNEKVSEDSSLMISHHLEIGFINRGGMKYIFGTNHWNGGVEVVNVTLDSLKAEQIKKELNK